MERSSSPPEQQPDLDEGADKEEMDGANFGNYPEPEQTSTEDLDKTEVVEFFEKKGAVEILAQLANGPKRFSEINDALATSHGTISTRLTKGVKLGLWEEYFWYPDEGSKVKLYQLKPAAEHLAEIAKEENIDETTERKRKINQQHSDAVSNFQDEIKTDDSET